MKAFVDQLSVDLSDRYVHYPETFLVDLWSEEGFIEFRCGFTLRADHLLRRFKIKVPALAGDTNGERRLIVVMIFDEIEEKIDLAIAERRRDAN